MGFTFSSFIQFIALTMIALCYVPQLIKLYKLKNADSQSVSFWVMLTIGLLANTYLAYQSGVAGGGWEMFTIQTINTLLSLSTLIMVWYYQKDKGNE